MSEQRWTDEQLRQAAFAVMLDYSQDRANLHVGRALLTLDAEVAQLRLNDQKYCERLAWLEAANAAFKGMEAERDALKLRVAELEAAK